ncbi:MAG: hypothetical protein KIT87_06615 [Anaerolineae bacterium]|nr:hypothetical protein [Anaerolineae bacterium]
MKQMLAIVGAGVAAWLIWAALQFLATQPAYGVQSILDPLLIRVITGFTFFAALIALDREALAGINRVRPTPRLDPKDFAPGKTPQETSADMGRIFSGVTDDASRRRAIREWLAAIPQLTVLIPFIFYLRFGEIGPLGWGLTVFFDVYCLLWAIGLYFQPRTEYHTPVRLRGDWADRIGAFWLVGCAFGPLFGWVLTEALPITAHSWQWVYGLRVVLAAGVPVLLALPLLRYVRGKAATVALPLLLVITLLPVSTAMQVGQDLWEGPSVRQVGSTGGAELYLKHTERSLGSVP